MKIGIRKPSLKKSISARTTGKVKRKFKRLTNPFYGKKGMGWVRNPKKALYNSVYRRTTVSATKSASCLVLCLWYPIYYTFVLMWWMLKYTCLGMWWLGVAIVNGIIALFEWIANRDVEEAPPATESRNVDKQQVNEQQKM